MTTYTKIPTYSAPFKVYQSAWAIGSNQQMNQVQKQFDLLINNKIVETHANVIRWSGGNGVAVYKDYVAMMEGDQMEGKHDLIIALLLQYKSNTENIDAVLKGVEIFKLSNPDNNRAGVNPVFTAHAHLSRTPRLQKLVLAFGNINMIATASSLYEELHRHFSLVEIQLATNYFDDGLVIGKGGFGNVYKGLIDKTKCVAIKRLNSKSKQGAHEFWAEIDALSKLRHNHLVSLIDYCDDCQEMILIYEYMAHRTLADHLYKASRNGSCNSPLSWERRLNICIGVARGLDFLHTSRGAHHGIIHHDAKSSNILLDENWVAKISDFGFSKMDTSNVSCTNISTNVEGTFGYLDPKYFMTRRLTKGSDVYAYGVVLFEVLCGRQAVDITLEEEQHSLALWVRKCIQKGTIDQLVDPSVKDQISPHCLRGFAEIANKCLHDQPNEWPLMAEITARLELFTLELQGRGDSYTEQEVIHVGGAFNESVKWSIISKDSPSVSRHYSIPPLEGINESRVLESISPGKKKNMELWRKKDDGFNQGPWLGWRLWGLFLHRSRSSKIGLPTARSTVLSLFTSRNSSLHQQF
ncbi:putative receptor-like protein kinase At5g39000 [Cornus florida]|uniref:putative receptor-like protein kinase At5g39000 n=1 Tax=Cornus florida TaxID=4283 RepID=UPI0028978909|nr:putative receptor-like protein kinase At5g39000 [Cornus florida]